MHLSKHHVYGNDFLIRLDFDEVSPARSWVTSVCNGNVGWGADGLIWANDISYENLPLISAQMLLFNADGSEAEISGNGLACLAQALSLPFLEKLPNRSARVEVNTAAGRRLVKVKHGSPKTSGWGLAEASVEMGVPRHSEQMSKNAGAALSRLLASESYSDFDRRTASALREGEGSVSYLSVGNPHVVLRLPNLECLRRFPLESVGAAMQASFAPVNLEVIAVEDRSRVQMRVWERGVGDSSACGSGAVAAAWQAYSWWLTDGDAVVSMPGGEAKVRISPDTSSVELAVEAIYVGDCTLGDYWRHFRGYKSLREKTRLRIWRDSKSEAWSS